MSYFVWIVPVSNIKKNCCLYSHHCILRFKMCKILLTEWIKVVNGENSNVRAIDIPYLDGIDGGGSSGGKKIKCFK